jgi:DNA-binding NtrC family response regulator
MKARIVLLNSDEAKRREYKAQLEKEGYEVDPNSSLDEARTDEIRRLERRAYRVEGNYEDRVWYVSKSKTMRPIQELLNNLRREGMKLENPEPAVAMVGEIGTGKEGIGRMIHLGSRRAGGPWISVNCAQLTGQSLDHELFGYERGAFNGADTTKPGLLEIAHGGTLFLDETNEMSLALQDKLLQAIQEKAFRRVGGSHDFSFDVRLIAASEVSLKAKVREGKFRDGLYQLLSVVSMDIPTLRERSEDIIPLAAEFAERSFKARGKSFTGFSPEAEIALRDYAWPGNVRELLSVVERAALISDGNGPLSARILYIPGPATGSVSGGPRLQMVSPMGVPDLSTNSDSSYTDLKKKWCDSFEREYLMTTLNRNGGNVSAAAREAKLDRSNFLRLLRRHGLSAQEYRKAA